MEIAMIVGIGIEITAAETEMETRMRGTVGRGGEEGQRQYLEWVDRKRKQQLALFFAD